MEESNFPRRFFKGKKIVEIRKKKCQKKWKNFSTRFFGEIVKIRRKKK